MGLVGICVGLKVQAPRQQILFGYLRSPILKSEWILVPGTLILGNLNPWGVKSKIFDMT